MFCTDQETKDALNSLKTAARDPARPLVIWVGAGVSVWAGYPLWRDLASTMHSTFAREVRGYDKNISSRLLAEAKYPQLFEQMRLANQPRYFAFLSKHFCPERRNGVYSRFVRTLRRLPTACLVTTNVDEALERNLPELVTVQRSDIERLPQLLFKRTPFVCKLHGSASSVETMVFSTTDYEALQLSNSYLAALRSIFCDATVVFLGYGLRDEYVIRGLKESSNERPLFGSAPHYIVTSEEQTDFPEKVQRIRYVDEFADHRASLLALEVLADFSPQVVRAAHESEDSKPVNPSLYFIADLIPLGTWETSQTLGIESPSGSANQMIIGEGYVNGEVEAHGYSALHDIAVGLICFDVICVSIEHLSRVHDLLGFEVFWILVKSGSLRIVAPPSGLAVVFTDERSPVGDLRSLIRGSRKSSFNDFSTMSISERIRIHLLPAPGKENDAEELFQILESTVLNVSEAKASDSLIEKKTLAALMHPSIRHMLGFSDGTPLNTIPRWLTFPVLRLARVVSSGLICQRIKASSTRMIFGSEKLASVAFSTIEGREWPDDSVSYVLTGRFDSDVGLIIEREPSLLLSILKFRESSPGENFRREVVQRLASDDGGQIVTAINSGLHRALPNSVLQQAHDQLSALFIPREPVSVLTPAVWGGSS